MANTLKLGAGKWATGTDTVLAFNDENNNFKPLPFSFSRASSATVVNQSGLIETVGSGEPRIDFKDNAKGALLLEPQRTNLITYSEAFDNAYWTKSGSSVVSGFVSPSGDLSAFKLVESATTAVHKINTGYTFTSGTSYSLSVYLKMEENRYVQLTSGNTVVWGANSIFDLQNGVISSLISGTSTITALADGWYKCTISGTAGISTFTDVSIFGNTDGTTSQETYTGDGTSGVYIYGAQLEVGSYATSYIPTSGQSGGVTRVGDVCNNGANSQVINSTEGVLYLEGSALADDVLDKRIFLSDGTMNNYVAIGYSRFAGNIIAEMVTGGVLQTVDWGATGVNKTNNNKFALSWGSGTMKFYVNGNQTNTESVTSPTGLNVLEFNTAVDTLVMYSNTRDLRVYNTALTSAELQALTTI